MVATKRAYFFPRGQLRFREQSHPPRCETATQVGWNSLIAAGGVQTDLPPASTLAALRGAGRFNTLELEVCGSPAIRQLRFFGLDPWIIMIFW